MVLVHMLTMIPRSFVHQMLKGSYYRFQEGISLQHRLFSLDAKLQVKEVISLEDYPRGNGGGVIYDVQSDEYIHLGMAMINLTVNRYDSNWRIDR